MQRPLARIGGMTNAAPPFDEWPLPSPDGEPSQDAAICEALDRVVSQDYENVARRLQVYRREQQRLARHYQIGGLAPEAYGEAVRQRIDLVSGVCAEQFDFAFTSGSTHEPKRLFYPRERLHRLQETFLRQVLLAYADVRPGRPAFYFLTSLKADNSISSLMARQLDLPESLTCIFAESVIFEPRVASLAERYPQDAIHLTLLGLVSPSMIVMANPSSLWVLLDRAQSEWERIRGQMAGLLAEPYLQSFIVSRGPAVGERTARLRELIEQTACPGLPELLPELTTVQCWQGGYVRPFLERLQAQFADRPPRFAPLCSFSTETVAALYYPRLTTAGGLPLDEDVCYEFLPEDAPLQADALRPPWELNAGERATMVVSDAYGLSRYHTEDLFECRGRLGDVPIIEFVGRAGLNYSFTGEKLTDRQLLAVYDRIRERSLGPGAVLTCFPKLNAGQAPSYVLVLVSRQPPPDWQPCVATLFDEELMSVNTEYASKRDSGRLTAPELATMSLEDLMRSLAVVEPRYRNVNPAQFKPLPLFKVIWESLTPRSQP